MEKDNDNLIRIRIVLTQSNILQEFAPAEDYLLNPQIEEYLLKQSSQAKVRSRLELETFALSDQKEVFSKALKNTFEKKILVTKNEKRRSGILALCMLLIGAVFLTISFLFESMVVHEIFLVASWVFLWGSVELFFRKAQKRT